MVPVRIFFFPDYRYASPYQTLLAQHVGPWFHFNAGEIDQALAELKAAPGSPMIFHLHWEDAVFKDAETPDLANGAVERFLTKLDDFKRFGGTFVWTVHNLISHDRAWPGIQKRLSTSLCEKADAVQFHGAAAWAAFRETYGYAPEEVTLIPHGTYPPAIPEEGAVPARRRAGPCRLLLFGRIAPYKGVEELIAAFLSLAGDAADLTIAGRTMRVVGPLLRRHERIDWRDEFIPEEELARLIGAADFVVLPYREVTSSGAMLLTLSLARPVIVPDLRVLTEIVADRREALVYPHASGSAGLAQALRRAVQLSPAEWSAMCERAAAASASYAWQGLAPLYRAFYRSALARRTTRL